MNWLDVLAAVNMVLIFGSFFLALGIIFSLHGTEGYTLAKGWPYILIAVLILSVNKVYEFFTEYTLYSYPRILRELLGFLFISAIFIGLLVQYLAIQDVIGHRRK